MICGKKGIPEEIRLAKDFHYAFCRFCSGATLVPKNKAISNLEEIYTGSYFDWGQPTGIKKLIYNLEFYKSYSKWVSSQSGNGKVLDVGAGTPTFLREMKEIGWSVQALELSAKQAKIIGKAIGAKNVYRGFFEDIKLPNNYFNAITFWHVLEHVKNPTLIIKKSHKLLQKDGVVYFEVPNVSSLAWKIFGDNYDLLRIPEHLFYFSSKSLIKLLESNGFKVLEISYPLKLNSTFSASLLKLTKVKLFFYVTLPISFILSVILSFLGRSEILRVSAIKLD